MTNKRSKRKQLRTIFLNPFFICLFVILLSFGFIVFTWHKQDATHAALLKNGVNTVAYVQKIEFSATTYRGGRYTTSEKYATSLIVNVTYAAGNTSYTEKIGMTYSTKFNDHVAVFEEATTGMLKVRYLQSDPHIVRPLAEFTDPKNNPASGGK